MSPVNGSSALFLSYYFSLTFFFARRNNETAFVVLKSTLIYDDRQHAVIEDNVATIVRELHSLSPLKHDGIMTLYGFFFDQNSVVLVTEYVGERTLMEWKAATKPFDHDIRRCVFSIFEVHWPLCVAFVSLLLTFCLLLGRCLLTWNANRAR